MAKILRVQCDPSLDSQKFFFLCCSTYSAGSGLFFILFILEPPGNIANGQFAPSQNRRTLSWPDGSVIQLFV